MEKKLKRIEMKPYVFEETAKSNEFNIYRIDGEEITDISNKIELMIMHYTLITMMTGEFFLIDVNNIALEYSEDSKRVKLISLDKRNIIDEKPSRTSTLRGFARKIFRRRNKY